MSVFTILDERVQAVLRRSGMTEPTPVQTSAIPAVLEGQTSLIIAPTGIGKTEAAMLPLLSKIIAVRSPGISLLYITPLRALNRDMLRRMSAWGADLGLDIAVRHGDTEQKERNRQSKKAPDVLITTPETLQILFIGKNLVAHLANVRYVVIDEIHELAQDERGAQLSVALERLQDVSKHPIQRIGLSATVGNPGEVGGFLAGTGRPFNIIEVPLKKDADVDVLVPRVTTADEELAAGMLVEPVLAASIRACKEAVERHVSTLLFVNTRDTAEGFSSLFNRWWPEFPISIHHGSLSKEARVEAEDQFKSGKLKALIATSSLELGIDVGHTDYILHYNSPRQVCRLVQRIGRSGHTFKGRSQGTIVVTDPDEVLESLILAHHMRMGWLEKVTVRKNPLNVLANQVMAMAMSKTGPEKKEEEMYATIKRAYPFKDLPEELFYKVVEYLRSIKTLWRNEGTVSHSTRTRTYFYENISMIPDEKKYKVVDITTRTPVATLDESYVASLEPYSKFIVKGRSWLLIEVEGDEILVQPADDLGTLPSWVGEDIPVPLEVAMGVGRLRRERALDLPEVVKEYLDRQAKESLMPTDRVVTIERTLNYIVINACFGSKVNETLGRYLSAMLATKHGTVVGLTTDPYRIMLEMPKTPKAEDIRLLLISLDPSNLEAMMPLILKNSSYVRWEIVNVGKKFGVIRKDLDMHMLNFGRLMDSLKDTVVFQEALSKVIWEDMDLENTKRVLKALRSGSVKMVEAKLSPIGRAGLESRRELLFPKKADRTILLALKRRLAEADFRLACLSCGANRRARVERLTERISCHRCDGVMMAVVRMSDEDSLELIRRRDRLPKGRAKDFQRLRTNADLVHHYGAKAVMALLARGVGPTNAGRILARQHDVVSEDWEMDFLRDILEAEVNYARTKKFWD